MQLGSMQFRFSQGNSYFTPTNSPPTVHLSPFNDKNLKSPRESGLDSFFP